MGKFPRRFRCARTGRILGGVLRRRYQQAANRKLSAPWDSLAGRLTPHTVIVSPLRVPDHRSHRGNQSRRPRRIVAATPQTTLPCAAVGLWGARKARCRPHWTRQSRDRVPAGADWRLAEWEVWAHSCKVVLALVCMPCKRVVLGQSSDSHGWMGGVEAAVEVGARLQQHKPINRHPGFLPHVLTCDSKIAELERQTRACGPPIGYIAAKCSGRTRRACVVLPCGWRRARGSQLEISTLGAYENS